MRITAHESQPCRPNGKTLATRWLGDEKVRRSGWVGGRGKEYNERLLVGGGRRKHPRRALYSTYLTVSFRICAMLSVDGRSPKHPAYADDAKL